MEACPVGVMVEIEAYSPNDPACHGYRHRSPLNGSNFGQLHWFYAYFSDGIHHCENVLSDRVNGAFLSAVALRDEPERIAAGPACWHVFSGLIAVMTAVR